MRGWQLLYIRHARTVCIIISVTFTATMEDINTYENVTSCLASSISHSNFQRLNVGACKTDLDLEVPSHYDVPRIQYRSRSLTALNVFATTPHHRLNIGSRSGSSSPLSDRCVEFQSASVPGSPESSFRHDAVPAESMNSRDRAVYNSLGTSSSKEGKVNIAIAL